MQEVLDTQASIMKFRLCNLCKEQSLAIALLLKALLRGEKAYPELKASLLPNTLQNKNTKKAKTIPSINTTISQTNTNTQEEKATPNETQSIPQIFPTLQIDS